MNLTPQESHPDLARMLGIPSLYLKREDLHPLGSHKGRSIPHMIDNGLEEGIRRFAISSSGNASLAAALYIKSLDRDDLVLDIIVGKHISPHKLAKLEKAAKGSTCPINIASYDRPLQTLFIKTQDSEVRGLRQSTDPYALVGYGALAEELLTIPDLQAVFVGTSSGTTAQALTEYFLAHSEKTKKPPVEVHIVQTTSCHPIAEEFAHNQEVMTGTDEESSIADAIVDKTAFRKDAVIDLIKKTNGDAWIATNEAIDTAIELAQVHSKIDISTNSALSIVGVMEASYTRKWTGTVVCMICGD